MAYELTDLPQSANVQAFWKFEEASGTIYDETTNNNDGSYNGALYQQTGIQGYALGFITDDYVEVVAITGLNITGDLTIAGWVNNNSLTTNNYIVNRYETGNGRSAYQFYIHSTDHLRFYHKNSSGEFEFFDSTASIGTDELVHCVATIIGSTLRLYINGIEDVGSPFNLSYSRTYAEAQTFHIGYNPGAGLYFDGEIDELMIWDKGLTPAEAKIVFNLGNGKFLEDTIILSDEIKVSLRPERTELSDTLNLSDEIHIARMLYKDDLVDTINLSDEIEVETSKNLKDTIILSDELHLELIERSDIDNDFRSCIEVLEDINNKFNSVIEVRTELARNRFNSVFGIRTDLGSYNDLRTELLVRRDILNDFRTLAQAPTTPPAVPTGFEGKSWEIPASVSFQSKGKEYIKVYIGEVEQTDVDIDTITITKILDSAHTATFVLGRAYDSGKPDMESVVEIKYDSKLLYKGYIIQIMPTDEPDTIKINCRDKFWKQNRIRHDFSVGHPPMEEGERTFYETIEEALSDKFEWEAEIGDFTPQTIDLNDSQESNAITQLINECGNYSWYYDENWNKKLWRAGEGSIINLQRQELNTNVNLYHVLRHSLTDDISNIINKYKVVMGDKVEKNIDYIANEGSIYHLAVQSQSIHKFVYPAWESKYSQFASNTNPEGINNPKFENEEKAKEAYTKYSFESLRGVNEEWDDIYPPYIEFHYYGSGTLVGFERGEKKEDGFTIDYENETLTLSDRAYVLKPNAIIPTFLARPKIKVHLWKVRRWEWEEEMSGEEEYESPLIFNTVKIGDYPETIIQTLSLSNLSVQEGGEYWKDRIWSRDEDRDLYLSTEGEHIVIPSWDDTLFAEDIAKWYLSQTCDKKTIGNINLTLDTVCHYGIDLGKRINIPGVTEKALNIDSINYNISSWTVTVNLKNGRVYKRATSIPYRGE